MTKTPLQLAFSVFSIGRASFRASQTTMSPASFVAYEPNVLSASIRTAATTKGTDPENKQQEPKPNNENNSSPSSNTAPSYPTTSTDFIPRYNGPTLSDMTPEQRSIHDAIVASRPRTGISGPFGPWIAIPSIAEPAQALGRACRYGTSLSFRESELVILLTGARHRSHTEFDLHQGEALRAGVTLDVINAIPRDDDFSVSKVTTDLVPLLQNSEREVAIVKFTAELLETCTVSDGTYSRTREALDGNDSVLVEITSIVGYYTYCAYTLNVFRIPSLPPSEN